MTYSRGLIYALLSGVFLSSGGLMVRFLEDADPWTVLFYRSLAFFVTVFIFMAFRYGNTLASRIRDIRKMDGLVSICLALGFVFYLLSLYHTSVANTVLLLSTGPFFAAILAWLVLREPVGVTTWVAMGVALLGVIVMVAGGVAVEDALGMIYAVLAVLSYAVMLVVLRKAGSSRELLPATALAGILGALLSIPFLTSFVLTPEQFWLSLVFGSVQVGSGFILITLAARTVPAGQIALLALTETALAPLWVWLVVNETPSRNTLMGGSIILTAVIVNGVIALRADGNKSEPVTP